MEVVLLLLQIRCCCPKTGSGLPLHHRGVAQVTLLLLLPRGDGSEMLLLLLLPLREGTEVGGRLLLLWLLLLRLLGLLLQLPLLIHLLQQLPLLLTLLPHYHLLPPRGEQRGLPSKGWGD